MPVASYHSTKSKQKDNAEEVFVTEARKLTSQNTAEKLHVTEFVHERRNRDRQESEEVVIERFAPGNLPQTHFSGTAEVLKRFLDIFGAVTALLIFSPIMIASAIAIKLTSKGPILFSQVRVGKGGKLFRMYKFRTMVPNAEALKDSLMEKNESSGPVFKMKKDPRVTSIGRILRKLSLDELPQLFQVLTGDMSMVGPRPPLPKEVKKYKRWQTQRLAVKPGITCIWQVSGRNEIQFEDWVRLDIKYIKQRSTMLDIKLILKTLKVVFIKPDGK